MAGLAVHLESKNHLESTGDFPANHAGLQEGKNEGWSRKVSGKRCGRHEEFGPANKKERRDALV